MGKSKLDKYKEEILNLRKEGKSIDKILDYLSDNYELYPDKYFLQQKVKKWEAEQNG